MHAKKPAFENTREMHALRRRTSKLQELLDPVVLCQLTPAQQKSVMREVRRTALSIVGSARELQKSITKTPIKELP